MKITQIKQQIHNSEKLSIFINDKYSFSISKDGCINESLNVGKEISTEDVERIKEKDLVSLLFLEIVNIFSYGPKTEYEIRNKIRRKYENKEQLDETLFEDCLNLAIEKGKTYQYINDEDYIENFIQYKIKQSQGKKKIQQELMKKGISYEISNKYFDELNIEDVLKEKGYNLAKKKLKTLENKNLEPYKLKQKIFQYLIQRGFSYEEVQEILTKLNEKSNR